MRLSELLRALMDAKGVRGYRGLAKATAESPYGSLSEGLVRRILAGEVQVPTARTLQALAWALGEGDERTEILRRLRLATALSAHEETGLYWPSTVRKLNTSQRQALQRVVNTVASALAAEVEDDAIVGYQPAKWLESEPQTLRASYRAKLGSYRYRVRDAPQYYVLIDYAEVADVWELDREEFDSPLSVSIYLEDGQESTVHDVQSALQSIAEEVGFELIAEFDPVYGSFWQKFRAKASDPHTQEEVYDRLIKLERSAEVRLLAVPESQANMQNAQGLAAIIESLKGESAAVIQLGPLVVVKAPTPDLRSAILCRVLTAKELRMLETHPQLLKDPCGLMEQLTGTGQGEEIEQAQ